MSQLPEKMQAMVPEVQQQALRFKYVPVPKPNPDKVFIQVHACGACRTDLHIHDAERGYL